MVEVILAVGDHFFGVRERKLNENFNVNGSVNVIFFFSPPLEDRSVANRSSLCVNLLLK